MDTGNPLEGLTPRAVSAKQVDGVMVGDIDQRNTNLTIRPIGRHE